MSHKAPRQHKYLSQVFLKETWPAQRMADVVADWQADLVLEIGPGDGVLTERLLQHGHAVLAVEKDQRFAERLAERWRSEQRFTIEATDVLHFDLGAWLDGYPGQKVAVVGNIPYHISTPILKWALPHLARLTGVGLMTQVEFAERLWSPPDQKSYGSLSVYTQMRADVKMVCKVPKEAFSPVPKVDSAIFTLEHKPLDLSPTQQRRVETITKAAFSQRRKKLRNGIKPWLGKVDAETLSIDLERRPGTLTVEEYQQLAREIFPEDFESR